MIYSKLLSLMFIVLSDLVEYLPNINTDSGFSTAITTGSNYLATGYSILPFIVSTLLAILVFDVIFETGYIIFKVVYWVIRRFPTQS